MSYSPPDSAKPFTLNISDKELSEWRQLLELSRLGPETWEGNQQDRRFGITHQWLSETKDYWLNKYDWRATEKHINSFANYKMQIENVDLHFVALFSEKKDAIPIMFMHGWPGSFIEFLPMIELIKAKYSAKDLPYHIVVPSLPGYTLSTCQSLDKSCTLEDSSRVMHQLMLNLGFAKYIAQGGDVGSFTSRIIGARYDACVGIHCKPSRRKVTTTMLMLLVNLVSTTARPDENTVMTAQEQESLAEAAKWVATGTAYAQEHATRPSTIGHVLNSNPLATLAWIGEKMLEWTDEELSLDTILTNVSLYWFTACTLSCLYPYRELFSVDRQIPMSDKPMGYSVFPKDVLVAVKSLLEKEANLVFYKRHERGGHFAALEKPAELWEDVEEFVGKVWKV